MFIISKVPPRFFADTGETITIDVTAQNTKFLVTYKTNGAPANLSEGSSIQFTMGQSQVLVVVQFGFEPPDGSGAYSVTIRGDKPGFTFSDTFDAKFGIQLLEVPFEFFVSNT